MATNRSRALSEHTAKAHQPAGERPAARSGAGRVCFNWATGLAGAGQLISLRKCQDLLGQRLRGPTENLFHQLTGLRLHAVWHQPLKPHKPLDAVELCPAARTKDEATDRPSAACRVCSQRFRAVVKSPALEEWRFVGQCGLTNVCAHIVAEGAGCPAVTLVLQAPIKRRGPATSGGVRARDFDRAARLLWLIHQNLTAGLQALIARNELKDSQRRLTVLKAENARLRKRVPRRDPGCPEAPRHPSFGRRAEHVVEEVIAYVHQHYQDPMSLCAVADALRMNASYLSSLFSQTAGIPFHQYLEEVRMARARELLRDPCHRISEVACAVGYAGADQFRHAFKAHAGVPPSAWR